jgi:EAL and modified HD-GYP domain-containing signal transduction protein
MGHKGEESSEILLLSLQRAKLFEALAQDKTYFQDSDGLFLLGLFSLLDTLLDMPMKKAVQYLPVKEEYASALRREAVSPLRPLLLLAERLEEGKRDKARDVCRAANLDEKKVEEAFREATRWSQEFFSSFN